MKYYFCSELNTNVDFKCNEFGEELEVLLFDYDDGVLLFPITIPFSSGRRFCAFVDTFKYPWLYNFLINNNIASPTYRCVVYNGCVCEEFNFMEEILYERKIN